MQIRKHTFTDPDLIELDRIWPLGQMLEVPNGGTIIVAGAYEGRYLHHFSERFPTAKLIGFEPQLKAFKEAQKRIEGRKVILQNYGLGTRDRLVFAGKAGSDGCSVASMEGKVECLSIMDAVNEFYAACCEIDLFLLNAEGSEWALIPYLLDEMMHHRIASIALQQHTKYASKERISRVKSYLAEYYDLIYSDGQIDGWEYWRRK